MLCWVGGRRNLNPTKRMRERAHILETGAGGKKKNYHARKPPHIPFKAGSFPHFGNKEIAQGWGKEGGDIGLLKLKGTQLVQRVRAKSLRWIEEGKGKLQKLKGRETYAIDSIRSRGGGGGLSTFRC